MCSLWPPLFINSCTAVAVDTQALMSPIHLQTDPCTAAEFSSFSGDQIPSVTSFLSLEILLGVGQSSNSNLTQVQEDIIKFSESVGLEASESPCTILWIIFFLT